MGALLALAVLALAASALWAPGRYVILRGGGDEGPFIRLDTTTGQAWWSMFIPNPNSGEVVATPWVPMPSRMKLADAIAKTPPAAP